MTRISGHLRVIRLYPTQGLIPILRKNSHTSAEFFLFIFLLLSDAKKSFDKLSLFSKIPDIVAIQIIMQNDEKMKKKCKVRFLKLNLRIQITHNHNWN